MQSFFVEMLTCTPLSPCIPYIYLATLSSSPHSPQKMAIFLCFLFFLISSATACDRCVHHNKAAYFSKASALASGACGYRSLALFFYGGHLAGGVSSLFNDGAGCGACFQIRCKNTTLCSRAGTTVILTDRNDDNQIDFVLSRRAFMDLANEGMGLQVLKLGIVDVEYKRVLCNYSKQNLAIRVEEMSQKPYYLAVQVLYQGGQTEIVAMDVAQVDSSRWTYMTRNYGAIWDTRHAPSGPLQFRFVVTGGYDGKWIWAKKVLPADWEVGETYDAGVQISDIAQEPCYPCDEENWT